MNAIFRNMWFNMEWQIVTITQHRHSIFGGGLLPCLIRNIGISSKTSDKIKNVGLHKTVPEEVLNTIDWNPSISKSNWLHVDIFGGFPLLVYRFPPKWCVWSLWSWTGHLSNSTSPYVNQRLHLPHPNEWEPTATYRWTCWVWEIRGRSSKTSGKSPIISEESTVYTLILPRNKWKMSTIQPVGLGNTRISTNK